MTATRRNAAYKAKPREYYLRLDKTRDVIEWQIDSLLDINGWDLQKAHQADWNRLNQRFLSVVE